ncbi:MAG: sugar phosphate isomerase/epimerase [Chloroflexi bacterium]|nr:sugar phosphate isomerase/epimerase [Chloroflexota bacterium]
MTRLGFHCHGLDHFGKVILSNGLRRGEFYNFPPDSLPELRREIGRHNLLASIHAPLTRLSWYPTPPTISFLCDVDPELRLLSLKMIQETMELAQDFGAEYVVVHFPVPPSTPVRGIGYDELRDVAWRSAVALADISRKHGLPIHIEGFGPSIFLTPDFIVEVTSRLEGLHYCFDIGHMHIAARRDGFSLYEFARKLAPHIGSVHMWNNRGIRDYLTFGHIPIHPSQRPEDGWVDIDRILRLIIAGNPDCRIILESSSRYPEALGGHDFRDGVEWTKDLIAASS